MNVSIKLQSFKNYKHSNKHSKGQVSSPQDTEGQKLRGGNLVATLVWPYPSLYLHCCAKFKNYPILLCCNKLQLLLNCEHYLIERNGGRGGNVTFNPSLKESLHQYPGFSCQNRVTMLNIQFNLDQNQCMVQVYTYLQV